MSLARLLWGVVFLFGILFRPVHAQSWDSNGSHLYYNDGNVGIGTSGPNYDLDIGAHVDGAFRIGRGGDRGRIWTEYTSGGPTLIFYDYDDRGIIRFRESPDSDNENNPEHEATIVGSRGNIGIGTNNPEAALDVEGTITATEGVNPRISRPHHTDPIAEYPMGLTLTGSENQGDWNWIRDASTVLTLRSPSSNPQRSTQLLMSYDTEMYMRSPSKQTGQWKDWVRFVTERNGKVGIGTTNPSKTLSVAGEALAEEVIVKPQSEWADFVFEESYELPSLEQVSSFIDEEGHLPDVPSAEAVKDDGLRLGEMDATLLQKVEELTLYAIEQKDRVDRLERQLSAQQKRADRYEARAEAQQAQVDSLRRQQRQMKTRLKRLERMVKKETVRRTPPKSCKSPSRRKASGDSGRDSREEARLPLRLP